MTPDERLAQAEKDLAMIWQFVSRHSGELLALQAACHALLMFAGDDPEVRHQVGLELEKRVASNLATSTNSWRDEAFELAAETIYATTDSMAEHRRNAASQAGEQSGPPPSG